MKQIKLGNLSVSRLIIGGNPFSGFSHQGPQKDQEMLDYFTTQHVKDTLYQAQKAGIDTHIGRADHHVMRCLREFWQEGGKLQWIAQTCPELGTIERGVQNAIVGRAKACYIHGGVMDNLVFHGQTDEVAPALEKIRKAGMPCGIAGHQPQVFEWAEKNIDVDFYMCCYYDPIPRTDRPDHVAGDGEVYDNAARDAMVATIAKLSKPVIHYKIFACGRNDPREAFEFTAKHLRPQDGVCIGVYPKDKADMLEEDVRLFEETTGR